MDKELQDKANKLLVEAELHRVQLIIAKALSEMLIVLERAYGELRGK